MCTVVCRFTAGEPLHILAVRDEFVSRSFDDPGAWWPDQPGVIGGRDAVAGGTWCACDVAAGSTALLVNRIERRDGTPSRGALPLLALAHGPDWPAQLDVSGMASFNLVLARPSGVLVWVFDGAVLTRHDLDPGRHMITSAGVDAADEKTGRWAPRFAATPDWGSVIGRCIPSADPSALVVRRTFEAKVYATVFAQLITAAPGELALAHTRTPWVADSWVAQRFG